MHAFSLSLSAGKLFCPTWKWRNFFFWSLNPESLIESQISRHTQTQFQQIASFLHIPFLHLLSVQRVTWSFYNITGKKTERKYIVYYIIWGSYKFLCSFVEQKKKKNMYSHADEACKRRIIRSQCFNYVFKFCYCTFTLYSQVLASSFFYLHFYFMYKFVYTQTQVELYNRLIWFHYQWNTLTSVFIIFAWFIFFNLFFAVFCYRIFLLFLLFLYFFFMLGFYLNVYLYGRQKKREKKVLLYSPFSFRLFWSYGFSAAIRWCYIATVITW